MPSERGGYRGRLRAAAEPELKAGERIVALLPFATVPKLVNGPKGRKNKVRFGIRQSWQRYRPLVVTDRRLLVFDSGRSPHPRTLLAAYPLGDVAIGPDTPGRWGATTCVITLPDVGDVPFETGRREVDDHAALRGVTRRSVSG